MNRLLLALILLCISKTMSAQYVYTIKADSVKITNTCDTAELIIENHSQSVPGFLYNRGRGRTEFRRPAKLNDSTIVLGADTIVLGGAPSANNGLSVSGKFIQLGQSPGASGNPAAFSNNREIPLNGYNMLYTGAGRIGINNTNPAYGLHVNRSVGILKDSVPRKVITKIFPSFGTANGLIIDTATGNVQRIDLNDIATINTIGSDPRNVLYADRSFITNAHTFSIRTTRNNSYLSIDSNNQVIGDYDATYSGMKIQINQRNGNIRIGTPEGTRNSTEMFLDDKYQDFSILSGAASQDSIFNINLANGAVRFFTYGGGAHTGTAVKSALFNQNGQIIEGELPVTSIAAGNGITVSSSGGANTIALNNILYDQGVYLPTGTTGTNVTNITVDTAMYVRQQGFVSVSATVRVTHSSASSASSFDLSIPITSNFNNTANLIGVVSNNGGTILANTANDRATINYISNTAGTETLTIEFRYRVL